MMRWLSIVIVAFAASTAAAADGKLLFRAKCGVCHLQGGTGTFMLGRRLGQQNALLEQLARNELDQQKERIGTYQIQARFALASMYDRAANVDQLNKDTKPKQKTESGEDVPEEAAPEGQPTDAAPGTEAAPAPQATPGETAAPIPAQPAPGSQEPKP